MGADGGPARDHLVALGHQVLDGTLEIREGREGAEPELAVHVDVDGRHAGEMADEVGAVDLVVLGDERIRTRAHRVECATDDYAVLLSGHLAAYATSPQTNAQLVGRRSPIWGSSASPGALWVGRGRCGSGSRGACWAARAEAQVR